MNREVPLGSAGLLNEWAFLMCFGPTALGSGLNEWAMDISRIFGLPKATCFDVVHVFRVGDNVSTKTRGNGRDG